jgi:CIC family chloride channel protein
MLIRTGTWFRKIRIPRWMKPAIGGAVVGVVALALPEARGVGYDTVTLILRGSLTGAGILLALVAGKILVTPVSIGSGFLGGVFAPALFLGAALGGAFGYAASSILPAIGLEAPAFAMVGMAAVLAGAVRCPLTATLLLFEMTNDYRIILPLMVATVGSVTLANRFMPLSIYTLKLHNRGITFPYEDRRQEQRKQPPPEPEPPPDEDQAWPGAV